MEQFINEQADEEPKDEVQLVEVNVYRSQLDYLKQKPGLTFNVLEDPPAQGAVLNHSHSKKFAKQPSIISAKELAQIVDPPKRYLLEPFLPVTGTALIAGKPDTGKSQFARQLAIEISQGASQFLGFKLELTHNRAVYVATEDDPLNCKFLSEKQHQGLGYEPNENLTFIFADNMDQSRLFNTLEKLLKDKPADLIVVDSFSDVFQGNDMNSNSQMRATTRKFDNLGKQFNCLILFVHHINKAGYDKSPSQQNIQGGSGLVQKVRLAWQMSSKEGTNIKYLAVTKGNYTPREYKETAISLVFDETTFTFTRNHQDKPVKIMTPADKQDEKFNRKIARYLPVIKSGLIKVPGLSYSALSELLTSKGIPIATAKRWILKLKEKSIIEQDDNLKLYLWNKDSTEEELFDEEDNTEEEEDLAEDEE